MGNPGCGDAPRGQAQPRAGCAAASRARGGRLPSPDVEETKSTGAPRLHRRDWAGAAAVGLGGSALRLGVLAGIGAANDERLGDLLNKWDAEYYTQIAAHGYFDAQIAGGGPAYEKTLAFFPGFPLLLRAGHALTGVHYSTLAVVLNLALTVVLAAGAMALANRVALSCGAAPGYGYRLAAAAVVTGAPMAIVFAMTYTEALFGALAIWALVALWDRRWPAAAALVFCLGLVRLTAVDMLAAFALAVLFYGRRQWSAWAGLAVSVVPLVAYLAWANSHLTAVGGYFGTQRKHWNSGFDGGLASLRWVATSLASSENAGFLLTTAVMLAAPLCLVLAWRRMGLAPWWFSAALMVNVLASDGIMHSRPRLLLPAVIVVLPLLVSGFRRLPGWVMGLLVALWVLFGAWFSAYMLAVFEWAI